MKMAQIMFSDVSSLFNLIQPPLLEVKLRSMQVSDILVRWLDYLIITTHQTT